MLNRPIQILLIEDNSFEAKLIKETLKRIKSQSFQVTSVVCFKEAKQQLSNQDFDLILSDLNLPDTTGLDTLQKIYENADGIPIVVITGLDDDQTAFEAIKQGAQDYLNKVKLNEEILFRVIRYAIERNRIKIASRESEEKYIALFRQSNDGIFLHDLQGNILDVNQRVLNILGYKRSELLALNISDLHPSYALEASKAAFKDVTTRGSALFEIDFRRKDGRIITAEVSASVFESKGKKVVQGIVRDITNRKITEQQLQLQDTVLKSAANGIVITNREGKIIWVNPAFTKLTGFKFEEAIGKNPRILKSGNHNKSFYKNLWDTILSGNIWHGELTNVRKDGTLYFEDQTITPVKDSSGEIKNFISIKTDITEKKLAGDKLKASEEKFRVVAETATEAIVTADISGKITYLNKSAESMFSYEINELIGKSLTLLIPERYHNAHQKGIDRFLETGESKVIGKTVELVGRKKDGREFPIDLSLSSWMSGGETFFTSIIRDITERKHAEEILRDREQKLRTVIEHSNELFYIHNTEHQLIYVSPQSKLIFGYAPEEMMVKWTSLTTGNPINDEGIKITQKAIETGERQPPYLLELKRKDGHSIFAEIDESPIINKKGHVVGISGALRDITQRRLSEEALRESEDKLRNFVETSIDLIFRLNKKGQIEYVSPKVKEFYGYDTDELIGQHLKMTTPVSEVPRALKALKSLLKGNPLRNFQINQVSKTGRVIPMEINAVPVKKHGKVVGLQGIMRDISERKQTEKALKERERYLSALNRAEQGLLTSIEIPYQDFVNAIGPASRASRAYVFLNHRDEEGKLLTSQVAEWCAQEIEPEIDNPELQSVPWSAVSRWEKVMRRGGIISGTVSEFPENERAILEPQKIRTLLAIPLVVGDEFSGFIGFDNCISDRLWEPAEQEFLQAAANNLSAAMKRKQAELALKESEDKFRSLSEQSPNMIFINRKGRIVYVNKKCEEMMGYSREELYSPDFNFLSLLAPEYLDLTKKDFARYMEGKEIEPYEYTMVNRAGKRINGIITSKLINYQGESAILGIITDITERKQAEEATRKSEEKYRTLFEESKDAIYISSVEGKFLDINLAGVQLFGYDSKEELLNVNIVQDIYHDPLDREEFQNELVQDGQVKDFEVDLRRKNDEKITVLVTATTVKDEKGKVMGYRGIIRDITEKKQLEQQLLQAQKMEAIGTLAGGIAHDFNNILSAILGYAELTKDMITDNGMVKKNLDQVYKAGLRAKDLIQQILTFSRQTDHKPQPLQIELIVKEVLRFLRASLPATIDVQQNIQKNCGYTQADPTQIHQIIMNLCTNAFDAMREKGGILEIELNSIEINEKMPVENVNLSPGKHLKLIIRDTGIGMDAETTKRIFDPFFTTKEAGVGTGLGLSVVHGMVKKHKGEITVDSEPGKGTTFNIYLPAFEAEDKKTIEEQQELLKGTEKILFVDDEEPIVQTGVSILEKLGYQVTGTTQSMQALEAFKQAPEHFDLVITDVTMPIMTGLDLAKNMLKIRSDIPIILITGFSEIITRDKAQQMGICDLIMKPILTADLSKVIRRTLDQHKIGV